MTEVPNNGHAMAPYMMSVGLWVGALAFCLMYPLTKYNGKFKIRIRMVGKQGFCIISTGASAGCTGNLPASCI